MVCLEIVNLLRYNRKYAEIEGFIENDEKQNLKIVQNGIIENVASLV
jgi:hypothetical protein